MPAPKEDLIVAGDIGLQQQQQQQEHHNGNHKGQMDDSVENAAMDDTLQHHRHHNHGKNRPGSRFHYSNLYNKERYPTDDDHNILESHHDLESQLFPFQNEMDENTKQILQEYANSIRNPFYETNPNVLSNLPYDIYDCPTHPPSNYPYEYPLMDILSNWNPNNTTFDSIHHRPKIYAAICRFDYTKPNHIQKALNYRNAEVPFVLRNDPSVLSVVQRWNTPNYLSNLLNQGVEKKYKNEYSETNHLMYFRNPTTTSSSSSRDQDKNDPRRKSKMWKDWKPPMSEVYLTYDEFVEKASQPLEEMTYDKPHWYFRVNAKTTTHQKKKNKQQSHFLFDELPFFQSIKNFYIVDPQQTRGINCRFGMNGNIAEAHFDGSRNFVMIFGGERRYVLSHPKHCPNLALYPARHPSGRHSELNWSDPDIVSHPEFKNAKGNEVVLQAGDVLYLPTHWFHFIISLNLNWQCNARSGITDHYRDYVEECGF